MTDLEITVLPIAEPSSLADLNTLGFSADGQASQVRLADLKPTLMQASRIDYTLGLYFTLSPFAVGSSELYINGLRNTLGHDYRELTDCSANLALGIEVPGIESSDSIVLLAIQAGQ